MPDYEIRYTTECTMLVEITADTKDEAIKKMTEFDIDDEPMEIDGGGFCKEDMISIIEV